KRLPGLADAAQIILLLEGELRLRQKRGHAENAVQRRAELMDDRCHLPGFGGARRFGIAQAPARQPRSEDAMDRIAATTRMRCPRSAFTGRCGCLQYTGTYGCKGTHGPNLARFCSHSLRPIPHILTIF